jgi:hypothetical protein
MPDVSIVAHSSESEEQATWTMVGAEATELEKDVFFLDAPNLRVGLNADTVAVEPCCATLRSQREIESEVVVASRGEVPVACLEDGFQHIEVIRLVSRTSVLESAPNLPLRGIAECPEASQTSTENPLEAAKYKEEEFEQPAFG